MFDNIIQSFDNLNRMRETVGLEPVKRHWHNLFMEEPALLEFFSEKFNLLQRYDFSLYYFLTRVYVPMFASFTGYGSDAKKDEIFDKSDPAARILFENFQKTFSLPSNQALGSIQGFVLEKK